RQSDFSLDGRTSGAPWLGMKVTDFFDLKSILFIGTNLRKDHPLIAARIRKAIKLGAQVSLLNPFEGDPTLRFSHRMIVAPSQMADALAEIVGAAQSSETNAIAAHLREAQPAAVLLGNLATHHPQYSQLHTLAQKLARLTGAKFGFLGEAANSVGAYLAKAAPFSSSPHGMNCGEMLAKPRRAYLLLGVEPELDCYDSRQATAAMRQAELVVAMSPYRAADYAHVMLPIAPFTETAGAFVNCEGRAQSFKAAVPPLGETRPGWKVLRVLGNHLKLAGFDFDTVEAIREEIARETMPLNNEVSQQNPLVPAPAFDKGRLKGALERIGDVPIYAADAIARRSPPLQETRDAREPVAAMRASIIERYALREGDRVRLKQIGGDACLVIERDDSLPDNCIRVAAGHPLTSNLGPMFGEISIERVDE
ncbi:MAG: molybdopterin-dependent oxidoreductase, partial [Burkholderiales bacterium]